jgi:hypothetical protein
VVLTVLLKTEPCGMWDFPVILTEGGPDMMRKRYTEEQIISIL